MGNDVMQSVCARDITIDISSRHVSLWDMLSLRTYVIAPLQSETGSVFASFASISRDPRLWHGNLESRRYKNSHILLDAHIETAVKYWATTAASALLTVLKCCPDDLTGNFKTSFSNDFLRPNGAIDDKDRKKARSITSKARRCCVYYARLLELLRNISTYQKLDRLPRSRGWIVAKRGNYPQAIFTF